MLVLTFYSSMNTEKCITEKNIDRQIDTTLIRLPWLGLVMRMINGKTHVL